MIRTLFALFVLLLVAATAATAVAAGPEELARARSIARAHYQNEHFAKAAEVYRRCVELAPQSVIDRINLAVAEGKSRETEQALASARVALSLDASYPHSLYLIGLMSFRSGEMEAAATAFAQLFERDPLCVPALYAHGQALYDMDRTVEAVEKWNRVIQLDPNHGPTFYQLFRYFTGTKDSEKAAAAFEEFIRIKDEGLGPGKTEGAVFRSRYFDLLEEEVPAAAPGDAGRDIPITLGRSIAVSSAGAAAVAAEDFDGDGDDDLLVGRGLYRNEGASFSVVENAASLPERVDAAQFGDLDNDGILDLAAIGTRLALMRGDGKGGFESFVPDLPSPSSMIAPPDRGIVRLVDIDHEGDLDVLYVPAGAELRLLRNNGNATFSDITVESGMTGLGTGLQSLVLSDLENDFDIDVLVIDAAGRPHLYVNERDGSFRLETDDAGLAHARAAVNALAGDLNNDANPDLVLFGGEGQPVEVWLNRGDARFHLDTTSPVLSRKTQAIGARSGHLVDLDNDGDLDLVAAGSELAAFRNDGSGGWSDWVTAVRDASTAGLSLFHDGDFDGDGDPDLVCLAPGGDVALLRNDGGNANHRVRIRLAGTKNAVDGYGCKVWTRAGSFFQLRESFRRWIDLGVGDRTKLDVLGVRWPTGVTQNEIDLSVAELPVVELTERPGLAESCPFVYAYDGERFKFVTDILDVTPLGISLAPGVPFVPNDREAILLTGEQLAAHDDRFSIRVTQELREISYLDRVELFVIDHPAGSLVVPNDHFETGESPARGLHLVANPQPPVSASDGEGLDVLASVLEADRVYADDCEAISRRYPGITTSHRLILDPGPPSSGAPLMLILRGTTLWTEASINVAVAQNPDIELFPISLDVVGAEGGWTRVRDDIGLPAGMDKFLPVDLRDVFPTEDRRVRITTNMAVLWDQAFFAEGPTLNVFDGRLRSERLSVLGADLHYRGFSEIYSPDGKLPDLYDYDSIYPRPLFEDVHAGDYTRYGDVTSLLTAVDDRFVVLAPGDEIAIEFPAVMLPDLPPGWARDFVFEADGWIKDGDLRTVTGETVAPLPFHGMSSYPYAADDEYPNDSLHRSYLEHYQTRTLPPWTRSARRP
jgi:tetratricopeptide (TPR) repeat protein